MFSEWQAYLIRQTAIVSHARGLRRRCLFFWRQVKRAAFHLLRPIAGTWRSSHFRPTVIDTGSFMKKIAIVGAGQAGLQLGFELLAHGCEVTLYTDRTSQQVLNGPTGPIAIQFHPRTVIEQQLGLDFWSTYDGARIDTTVMKLFSPTGEKVVQAGAMLSSPAQAIDLRLKYATWLMEFPRRGGSVVVGPADLALLEQAAA
jgi:hypothetical protein